MAHSLLLRLLAPALLVLAARAEYGARMPAYDDDPAFDRDDYHAHSPDAPAPLDYKYEEDIKAKTEVSSGGEARGTDSWQRPDRKKRKRIDDDDDRLDDFDKFDAEEDFQKPKLKTHITKHRPRIKSRKFDRSEEDIPNKYSRTIRERSDDRPEFKIDEETHLEKDDFGDENVKSLDSDDNIQLAYRTSSVRAPRRRPRDRYVKKVEEEEDDAVLAESGVDRDVDLWRLGKDGELMNRQMAQEADQADRRRVDGPSRSQGPMMRQRPAPTPYIGASEHYIEDPPGFRPLKGRSRNRGPSQYEDDENNDYYDMKRVLNMKNKLPTLMRRTEARLRLVPAPSARSLEDLLANRRMLPPTTTTSSTTPLRTTTSRTTPVATTATRTTIQPTPTATTTPITSTVTTAMTALVNTTAPSSKELSLAEKSRLSILKKAQRKEDLREEKKETKKPAVLLQVTRKVPTVVMVEPPSSPQPWMRARQIEKDSPKRLQKVKKLMRQKLLANARSIHDLTDNWDDTVCDYVDMSLLDNRAPHAAAPLRSFVIAIALLINFAIFSV